MKVQIKIGSTDTDKDTKEGYNKDNIYNKINVCNNDNVDIKVDKLCNKYNDEYNSITQSIIAKFE